MRTIDHIRKIKRDHMRRMRADPEKRHKMNLSRRGKYSEQSRAYSEKLKSRHFFRWRARNWSHYGSATALDLMRLWKKQRGRCALSGGKLGRDAHLDHIIPRSKGGEGTIGNIRWVDPWVNVARQDLTDEEFASRCSQIAEWIGRRIIEASGA